MTDNSYEKGKVKVVWIERDPEKIYSKMFDTEKAAEQFAKTKGDYIIFALEKQRNMEEFCWRILPYGRYVLYKRLVKTVQGSKNSFTRYLMDIFSK